MVWLGAPTVSPADQLAWQAAEALAGLPGPFARLGVAMAQGGRERMPWTGWYADPATLGPPLLGIWGEKDTTVPLLTAAGQVAVRGRVAVVPGAGHSLYRGVGPAPEAMDLTAAWIRDPMSTWPAGEPVRPVQGREVPPPVGNETAAALVLVAAALTLAGAALVAAGAIRALLRRRALRRRAAVPGPGVPAPARPAAGSRA